jgi:hypothetical protein
MNYLACWKSKKALVSTSDVKLNTRANRVAIVCSIITKIFNPMQMLDGHLLQLTLVIFMPVHSCPSPVIIILLLSDYCFIVQFHRSFSDSGIVFKVFCSH